MKKLTILFTTSHADTLGNACRLEMVDYLTQHFVTTMLTNQPKQYDIDKQVKRIVEILDGM